MTRILEFACRESVDRASIERILGGSVALAAARHDEGRAAVLDSFDRRLRARGLALTSEHKPSGCTLSLRREDGTPVAALALSCACPRMPRALPASMLRRRVGDALGGRALLPVVECATSADHYTCRDEDGKQVCRLVLSRYAVLDQHEPVLSVLELKPVRGYGKETRAIARRLRATLRLEPLAAGVGTALEALGREPARALALRGDMPTAPALGAILHVVLGAMRANEAGIREDIDNEFLHDFRVAMRRSRSLMNAFKSLFEPSRHKHLRGEFSWLSAGTSHLRDLDVMLAELEQAARGGGNAGRVLGAFVAEQRRREHERVVRLLTGARYLRFVREWEQALIELPETAPGDGARRALDVAASDAIWRMHGRCVRRVDRLGTEPELAPLHELRKDLKRLRYLVEAFAGIYPARRVKRITTDLKRLQSVLGDICDRSAQHALIQRWQDGAEADPALAAELARLAARHAPTMPADRADELGRLLKRFRGEKSRSRYARLCRQRSQ
jgi:CHAD domain-containing protein